jgi:hypothetical protein
VGVTGVAAGGAAVFCEDELSSPQAVAKKMKTAVNNRVLRLFSMVMLRLK